MTPFLKAAVQHLGTNEFTVINGEEIEFPDGTMTSSDDLDAIKAAAAALAIEAERDEAEASINAERDRRICDGLVFNGVKYQTRPEDRENIAGASTAALAAMVNGAQPGDYLWHGGDSPFVWIAEDNLTTPMDAHTMFAFGQAAMAHKQRIIFTARAIKDMNPLPEDVTEDSLWNS